MEDRGALAGRWFDGHRRGVTHSGDGGSADGNRRCPIGNRESGMGNRESGIGDRRTGHRMRTRASTPWRNPWWTGLRDGRWRRGRRGNSDRCRRMLHTCHSTILRPSHHDRQEHDRRERQRSGRRARRRQHTTRRASDSRRTRRHTQRQQTTLRHQPRGQRPAPRALTRMSRDRRITIATQLRWVGAQHRHECFTTGHGS
jgi:hypothetical protein